MPFNYESVMNCRWFPQQEYDAKHCVSLGAVPGQDFVERFKEECWEAIIWKVVAVQAICSQLSGRKLSNFSSSVPSPRYALRERSANCPRPSLSFNYGLTAGTRCNASNQGRNSSLCRKLIVIGNILRLRKDLIVLMGT